MKFTSVSIRFDRETTAILTRIVPDQFIDGFKVEESLDLQKRLLADPMHYALVNGHICLLGVARLLIQSFSNKVKLDNSYICIFVDFM